MLEVFDKRMEYCLRTPILTAYRSRRLRRRRRSLRLPHLR